MPNRTHIEELNKERVCQHLSDVTAEEAAWVFLQEPGFIGFGVVMKNDICFPPGVSPDWQLTSDLRLFGEKGEWHVWRDWDGKHYGRFLKLNEIDDALTEYHFLWGTKKVDIDDGTWIKVVEKRGAEIWLPLASEELQDSDLPLRLKLKQIVDYDTKSHLAGITDAALIELTKSNKSLLQPPSIMSAGS